MEKLCTKCKEKKSLDAFPKDPARPAGRKCYCKDCFNKASKARRKEKKDEVEKYLV